MNVNRSTVVSSLAPIKSSEKTNINIPNSGEVNATSSACLSSEKHNKSVREAKCSDKTSEKVSCRRDSNSNSPRADVKTRRNSDTSARRIEDSEKFIDTESSHKERIKSEEEKKDRLEKARLESERLEREKLEKERIEKERMEKEKQERERIEKERLEKERLERESELEKQRLEKERLEKERIEKEKQEKERAEREKERAERLRQERERAEKERLERERIEKERQEQERRTRERKERDERERKEKEERERREREEQQERERLEMLEREKKERERKEKEERERREREELQRKEREENERKEREEREMREEEEKLARERIERERAEKEKLERDRKREEERSRHKEDNHDKRKDDHKNRENHSEIKHRENSLEKHIYDNKNTKESSKDEKCNKDNHDPFKRDSHDSRSGHEKSRHHIERDAERRKESIKENRDNNIHDKHKNFNDLKDSNNRNAIESRHMSIDMDKSRAYDSIRQDPNKRKERNNSLPANIGSKRRLSSHDSLETTDDSKRIKLNHDHKKLNERRDSKDSTRSEERSKSSKYRNNMIKSHEKHTSKDTEEKRKDRDKEREERHKKHKLDKQKSKSKSREKESRDSPTTPKSPVTDKDFLARLDLKSNEEVDKRADAKESKEKLRKEPPTFNAHEEKDRPSHEDRIKKEKLSEKQHSAEKHLKIRSDIETVSKSNEERKKRDRIRKITNSSESDSDEPKKHSIFDIVDDEPAYISMYDKVKARSCKNMAKQEEEKRQEKIKAKFSQLKQSRAKREEKKRSTSWDEDSESEDKDSNEVKIKRCPKMLIDSSDDESHERKIRKKKEIYSDSDSSAVMKQIKREQFDTSEDEIKSKNVLRGSKSRITSDTSEDEYNKRKLQGHIKREIFSDTENANIQGFIETEEKPQLTKVKDELERLIKKERRNSKHQDSSVEMSAQIFGDSSSTLNEKIEKFGSRHTFIENTTDDEITEASKKERSERREKKHKKKQKKQKHSLSSDDLCKVENEPVQGETSERSKHEKKKDHSKKDKRRDKTKEGREKSKKSKRNKSESKTENKREGKMENIFGSLSEDSEHGGKEVEQQKSGIFHETVNEEEVRHVYNSESERELENKAKEKEERDREREEHKRRKEKKRREKERRLQEAAAAAAAIEQTSNDNSMDYADMGKQLEANMMKDESLDAPEEVTKAEVDSANLNHPDDPFHFNDVSEIHQIKKEKEERKEGKEKKKKRKKSKDEKSKHHHHHHHHDKSKVKSPEFKKEVTPPQDAKAEIEEPQPQLQPQSQSLPTLLDEGISPPNKTLTPDFTVSPSAREIHPVISPIPKTPTTSKEKKRDKFIPGFGVEIDDKIHESAVKSISEFEPVVKKEEVIKEEGDKDDKESHISEEKPRVVISQEETEDAVAALLGESFENGKFEECYNDEINSTTEQAASLVEQNNAQDDEEMRQAVESLNATDLDVKPDTPQSEHELQIDTDTEEQEEVTSRFEPKTPEISDFSQPPKTPDIPRYIRNEDKIPSTPIVVKNTPNIGSPPSLTPIKPQVSGTVEIRKSLDVEQKSLPMLPEQQQRSVISQAWSVEKQSEAVSKLEPTVIKIETKKLPSVSDVPQQAQTKNVTTQPLRQYTTPPMVKISESVPYPALKPITQPDQVKLSPLSDQSAKIKHVPLLQTSTKSAVACQLHNLPARSPVQINKPPTSMHDPGILSSKSNSSLVHNRLPITPVMVSKPLQAATVILQQSKVAHSLEPPKLVSTSELRTQERPRMVFQTSAIQPTQFPNFAQNQPRMLIQGNIRQLPPQGLLVPTRQLPQNTYGYLGNITHSPYISPVVKDTAGLVEKNQNDTPLKMGQPMPPGLVSSHNTLTQSSIIMPTSNFQSHMSLQQPLPISKEQPAKPSSAILSPKVITSTPSPKPFMPSSPSPKLSPAPSSSPKPVIPTSSPPATATTLPSSLSVDSTNPSNVTAQDTSKIPDVENPLDKKLNNNHPNVIQKTSLSPPTPITESTLNEPIHSEIRDVTKAEPSTEAPVKLAIEKVTEELNMSLEKESPEIKEEKEVKTEGTTAIAVESAEKPKDVKDKVKDECKKDTATEKPVAEPENTSVIKEIDKFDEEKADTESIVSDISKERSSADILTKDPLDTKEDSDYWSAKEVNIDSVIKTLCSADELSDHSSENGKDDWFDDNKTNECPKTDLDEKDQSLPENKSTEPAENKSDESEIHDEGVEPEEEQKEVLNLRSGNRGRGGRGRGRGKTRGVTIDRSGIQTRRGKITKELPSASLSPTKRGRGGRPRSERKTNKCELDSAPADVYEFRDESDDNKEQRPRLILTIKSPAVSSAQTTAIVKEVTKDGAKEIGKEQPKEVISHTAVEPKEEFASPVATNTRKSRRLQEKDNSRNTVDDTIEDVVKNTIQTRAAANHRRSTRQAAPKQQQQQPLAQPEAPRKSPRGRKPRRASEATENSSSEETFKEESKSVPSPPKEPEKTKEGEKEAQKQLETLKEKPHEGLKAAMLRRIKVEMANTNQHEPTNLIDPVTGELIPMRECEEGKYIPLPDSAPVEKRAAASARGAQPQPPETIKSQPTVIAQPQQATVVQSPKPQSFKAHVLSSQAAQAAVSQQPSPVQTKPSSIHSSLPTQPIVVNKTTSQVNVSKSSPVIVSKNVPPVPVTKTVTPVVVTRAVTPIVISKTTTPVVISKPVTPINQHLSVNTSLPMGVVSSAHLSPRPNVPLTTSKAVPKQLVKPPVLSPVLSLSAQQKQQMLQVSKAQLTKSHMVTPMTTSQAQMVNTQLAHMKHQPVMKQQVIMGKGPISKPAHSLHQQQLLSGAVPSPPSGKSQSPLSNPSRIIQGPPSGAKGVMEPPKVDVSMANVMLGQRQKLSPQGAQQRLLQSAIPVPGYEASLVRYFRFA